MKPLIKHMNKYVTDTQALIKFLNGVKAINDTVDQIFKRADAGENIIIIPSVVIFEVAYLHEKKKVPVSITDIENILESSLNYLEEPLSLAITKSAFEIKDIPELHDRLIAGTARQLDIPILTNDPVIMSSAFVKCVK